MKNKCNCGKSGGYHDVSCEIHKGFVPDEGKCQNELIEWRESKGHDTSWGYVADRCVFTITKPYTYADNHNIYWGLGNPGHNQESTVYSSLEAAKTKAGQLFTEWLAKAKLTPEPVHCPDCQDSGEIWVKDCTVEDGSNMRFDGDCPCTKNPASFYSLKQRMVRLK
jgi:hypothetical protein